MSSESAKKAWETRKQNSKLKTYNSPAKNKFRNKVIESFGKYGSILTLESPELLFVDSMPNHRFTIFETNPRSYKKIIEANRPNICKVFNTDISASRHLGYNFDYIFLDFCNTFETCYPSILAMMETINSSNKIALTFCLRGNKKEIEDSKFDMASKIQRVFNNFDIEYGETYADGAPMVGFILVKNRYNSYYSQCDLEDLLEIHIWCQKFSFEKWGHSIYGIYGNPYGINDQIKIINRYAKTNFVVDETKFDILYKSMPKRITSKLYKLIAKHQNKEWNERENKGKEFLSYQILGRYIHWEDEIERLNPNFKWDYWRTKEIKEIFENKDYWEKIKREHLYEYHKYVSIYK